MGRPPVDQIRARTGVFVRRGLAAAGLVLAASPVVPASGASLGPIVRLHAEGPEATTFPPLTDPVDGLEPDTVLRLRVDGFGPFARARAHQCVASPAGRRCANPIDVQFDAGGAASFQYLVFDDFGAAAGEGRCRALGPPCSIVVEDVTGTARAEIATVFHDELPPPGAIRVSPRTGLVDGQAVTVEAAGFPPGLALRAMLCAAPTTTGNGRCGPPGPTALLTVGPDGTARTTLMIRRGPVGRERAVCGRGAECGVSVTSESPLARAPVAPLRFARPPGADYDPARLAGGLATAGLLAGLAVWLVRRTDWSPVGEAAAPEIDNAEYADLDALVAAMPPEDDLDESFVPPGVPPGPR